MLRSPRPSRLGFTLFQLLLVLAILIILLALMLPALVRVRVAAARSQCANNLKQIALAMHNCNDTYGKLPPAVGSFPAANKLHNTYFFYVLPFIEQANLYNRAQTGDDFSAWTNEVYSQPIKTYLCPQDNTGDKTNQYDGWLATCNYAANYLVFGDPPRNSLEGSPRIPATFLDGTSNTIVFAERLQVCGGQPNSWAYAGASPWTPVFAYYSTDRFQVNPSDQACDPELAQGPHPGGLQVGIADGSVRFLSEKLSETTWYFALTPNGGEVFGADW